MKRHETQQEIFESLLASFRADWTPPKPPAPPKPRAAVIRAEDRWAQKPTEAVIQDEAAHNEALLARLKAEAEAEDFQRLQYQALIDRVWQNQLDYQASLRELGGYHRGPGDPDWRG